MLNCIVMIPFDMAGASANGSPYSSVEDALSGARILLSNGATSAWIVDTTGGVLLPADEVRFRLGSIEEPNYALTETNRPDDHKFQPILAS